MCGIVTGYGAPKQLSNAVYAAIHRGPDSQGSLSLKGGVQLGHTRLSIIDKTKASSQPFKHGRITLIYNGELWNYKTLREDLKKKGRNFKTTGDTEVVAQALDEWGIKALSKLDGMFGLAWHDGKELFIARDIFGEVPLYYSSSKKWAASEQKILQAAGIPSSDLLPPGSYLSLSQDNAAPGLFGGLRRAINRDGLADSGKAIDLLLGEGVKKKLISDVPVCCLLSGGIDSSLILAHIKRYIPDIVAYTAVFNEKSTDLKRARLVAKHLGVKLIEVPILLPSKEDLEKTIRIIEAPFKAQVEIAWACLALAKRIKADGFKVTFTGEGADEMFGSYGFAYHAIAEGRDWGEYRLELFKEQHRKNFIRCNKIFMSQGIECRLPFLHAPLVEYVTGLSYETTGRDKKPLKAAAEKELPKEVVHRPKVAFQDGLGLKQAIEDTHGNLTSWYKQTYKKIYETPLHKFGFGI